MQDKVSQGNRKRERERGMVERGRDGGERERWWREGGMVERGRDDGERERESDSEQQVALLWMFKSDASLGQSKLSIR